MTATTIALLAGGAAAILLLFLALSLRAPPKYAPDEIARDAKDPTVTTIARRTLVTTPFFENGKRVARAETFGLGDRGIRLRIEGDPREMLLTTAGDWFDQTRFGLRGDVKLRLVIDGKSTVTAQRVVDPAVHGRRVSFEVDAPQGHFELVALGHAKFGLLRGDKTIGIAAMPLPGSAGDLWHSRIELPGSLPLETRVFLALLVKLEDEAR